MRKSDDGAQDGLGGSHWDDTHEGYKAGRTTNVKLKNKRIDNDATQRVG